MGSTSKSAQESFEIIWQLYIDDNKLDDSQTDANQLDENQLDEETRQSLSDVDVVWKDLSRRIITDSPHAARRGS